MSTTGPVFAHDCEGCEYLGQYEEHDLYYCSQQVGRPTVIARWSGRGPDYSSGVFAGAEYSLNALEEVSGDTSHSRALRVAYLIAKDLGRRLE